MNDENYFIQTYKEAAFFVRDEVLQYSSGSLTLFPQSDELREETIRFVVEGGKRFRPSLAYLTAKYLGVDSITPCLSLEYFHKYLLAHDDIIDQDRIRYASPTVHAKMEELYSGVSDIGKWHFGNSIGIISGDLMSADSYNLILDSDISNDKKVELCKLISLATEEVAYGWYIQFLLDYKKFSSADLSQEKIIESINWVTSTYTIKFPMLFGYALADKMIPIGLDRLVLDMGLLFQTGDDVIGIFGDPEVTQKSNYGDIVQGKKTLPMWFAYTLANVNDKAQLDALVGKEDLTVSEAEVVREIVRHSGGLEKTREYMSDLKVSCISQIEQIDIPEDMKRFLKGFTLFLEKRDM